MYFWVIQGITNDWLVRLFSIFGWCYANYFLEYLREVIRVGKAAAVGCLWYVMPVGYHLAGFLDAFVSDICNREVGVADVAIHKCYVKKSQKVAWKFG